MQATQYFDSRLVEVSATGELVIEYQASTLRVPGYPRTDGKIDEFLAKKIGQIGVATFVSATEHHPAFYRFEPYGDQTMRRAYELDDFRRPQRAGMGYDGYNEEVIGWRSEAQPEGFLAPRGLVPGANGFIADDTENITIAVPREFYDLCAEVKKSAEDVLRGFIADVAALDNYLNCPRADGYGSNGSDERMMARDYFERAHGMWRDENN
ncbi:hypothetical protein [Burkholderia cenocepacia]|uniref:hypothetical protein n=1 Tax=Burkholderia cenocepacia TaxID=95486 RepID=UPI000F5B1C0F|nr:hypothetical protein [Burkholderia cenocepacia]RQU83913.1 hypothetical protein DF040_33865 [Burkholderia cenocepacia]